MPRISTASSQPPANPAAVPSRSPKTSAIATE